LRAGGARPAPIDHCREQGGLTIVEVMIAAVILVIGALGGLQLVDASTRSAFRAEQGQVAIDRAQGELEEIRALPFDEIALTTTHAYSAVPSDPRNRIAGSCASQGVSSSGCFALNQDGTDKGPLVVDGDALEVAGEVTNAAIAPGPEPFTSGDVSGSVYRFVVWQDDPSCAQPACPGTQDLKRVVIVVALEGAAFVAERPYREIHSNFVDPDVGRDVPPAPAPANDMQAQEFWLSDTACDSATRQSPSSDHPLHNTLGTCLDGLQTGSTAGAPDLLLLEAPPLDPAYPDNAQPLYDFASDVEPVSNPGADRGIQLIEPGAAGCAFTPSDADAHQKVHRWVTEPMAAGFTYVLEETATLDLWTRTLGDVLQSGELCVFLFIREDDGEGGAVDTLIADAESPPNAYFSYASSEWPRSGWGEARIAMRLQPPSGETAIRILPGQRLGVAVTLERDGTGPEDALQFLYEHPDFDSRLEVDTQTPIHLTG
jgi:type II secretory pathway pseudopilin PulG